MAIPEIEAATRPSVAAAATTVRREVREIVGISGTPP
jgi:hypothetical protein